MISFDDDDDNAVAAIVEGRLCSTYGQLCGFIYKFGTTTRNADPSCPFLHEMDKISSVGFYDPTSSATLNSGGGPMLRHLLGGAYLYYDDSHSTTFRSDLAYYVYQDEKFALKAKLDENGNVIEGRKVKIIARHCDQGLIRLKFSDPIAPNVVYHYDPPGVTHFGDQPNVVDEIAEEYVTEFDTKGAAVSYSIVH